MKFALYSPPTHEYDCILQYSFGAEFWLKGYYKWGEVTGLCGISDYVQYINELIQS